MYSRVPTAVKTEVRGVRSACARYRPHMDRWHPGDSVVLREVWAGRVFEARPATVVQDEPWQQMFFVPTGVTFGLPLDEDGTELRLPDRPWDLRIREVGWLHPVLSFAWPDTPYSILLWWVAGVPQRWYVNLQAPLRRTSIGFDTTDHALDVLVALDGTEWEWKDEEELADAVRDGLFTEDDAAWFRHWGERAVEHIVLRLPPFDVDWRAWTPDPSWPMPVLPEGWDVV